MKFNEYEMKFREEELPKWTAMVENLFSGNVPDYFVWHETNQIVNVLNTVSYTSSRVMNHTFLPASGGLDLLSASTSHESDCIELNFDGTPEIVKPQKLMFRSFKPASLEWAYFRLETGYLKPSGIYTETFKDNESLVELSPCEYKPANYLEDAEYRGEVIPQTARDITRQFKGSYVMFSKASLINLRADLYDGELNRVTDEDFARDVQSVIKALTAKK